MVFTPTNTRYYVADITLDAGKVVNLGGDSQPTPLLPDHPNIPRLGSSSLRLLRRYNV